MLSSVKWYVAFLIKQVYDFKLNKFMNLVNFLYLNNKKSPQCLNCFTFSWLNFWK